EVWRGKIRDQDGGTRPARGWHGAGETERGRGCSRAGRPCTGRVSSDPALGRDRSSRGGTPPRTEGLPARAGRARDQIRDQARKIAATAENAVAGSALPARPGDGFTVSARLAILAYARNRISRYFGRGQQS